MSILDHRLLKASNSHFYVTWEGRCIKIEMHKATSFASNMDGGASQFGIEVTPSDINLKPLHLASGDTDRLQALSPLVEQLGQLEYSSFSASLCNFFLPCLVVWTSLIDLFRVAGT